ncbi:hypothetical protein CU097_015066, partial [Rhizopus azygosporus]
RELPDYRATTENHFALSVLPTVKSYFDLQQHLQKLKSYILKIHSDNCTALRYSHKAKERHQ